MKKIISLLIAACFCTILYAQDKSDVNSNFHRMNITSNTPVLTKKPDKNILIEGNPSFRTWVLDSLSKELTCGIWEGTPGKWKFENSHWEYCRILSGVSIITEDNGNSFSVKAGDSFILKPGFSGTWEVVETTQKDFVAVNANENEERIPEVNKEGIVKAIEYYIEGGRKGDSKITAKAFSKDATMSWFENGHLQSVPIQALYDIVDNDGASSASYKLMEYSIEQNIATARIQSQFGYQKYVDMFTLVKDGDNWKIVSKVYFPL